MKKLMQLLTRLKRKEKRDYPVYDLGSPESMAFLKSLKPGEKIKINGKEVTVPEGWGEQVEPMFPPGATVRKVTRDNL